MDKNLLMVLNEMIPEGTNEEFEKDGIRYKFVNEDGLIKIEAETVFDDSYTKEAVTNFKENIKVLDDDIFVKSIDELRDKIDLNRFDELLDLEEFTEEEADEVEKLITDASTIICSNLQSKIQEFVELYDRF